MLEVECATIQLFAILILPIDGAGAMQRDRAYA